MDRERTPTCEGGSGPTQAQDEPNSAPAVGVLKTVLAGTSADAMIRALSDLMSLKLSSPMSFFLAFFIFLWSGKPVLQTLDSFIRLLERVCSHSVTISQMDDMYRPLLDLLSKMKSFPRPSNFTAHTVERSASDDKAYIISVIGKDECSTDEYKGFLSWLSNLRPEFLHGMGIFYFVYKGTLFLVTLTRRQVGMVPGSQSQEREELKITCFSLSKKPIERLLIEAKKMLYESVKNKIRVYGAFVPASPFISPSWRLVAKVAKRSLDTVVLAKKTKEGLVNEIIEFLKPETQSWYVSRGIPWRRGSLLYGPPGTGKTSFVQAVAGHLDLPLYVIDLQHHDLLDSHLMELFRLLPRRSIVLIEDVDVTGIQAGASKEGDGDNRKAMVTKKLSYSAILNSIDGLASQEGRFLIMTTNRAESLDEALIRPGRVDSHYQIGNATQEQAAELFCLFYQEPTPPKEGAKSSEEEKGAKSPEEEKGVKSPEEITRLSHEFGAKIPDGLCSPAEIQGFLLSRKRDIQKALDDVENWVETTAEQKGSGSHVRTMQ